MQQSISDAAYYYVKSSPSLGGMSATLVEEIFHAGTPKYTVLSKRTEEKFQCKDPVSEKSVLWKWILCLLKFKYPSSQRDILKR